MKYEYGNWFLLIIGGLLLISSAWNVLYKAQRKNTLAVTGAYHYVRHPQYTGFVLIIVGFLLQWPTIITILMAPVLIFRYIKLAGEEERTMLKKHKESYEDYRKETPGFFLSLKLFVKYLIF